MTSSADPRGYYRLLGVKPGASAEDIKTAFRKKAKLVHPDYNPDPEAGAKFLALTEAYHNLSNPTIRASYDSQQFRDESEPIPAAAPRERPQPEHHGFDVAPVICSRCGNLTAQPRYIIFWQVISYIFLTVRYPIQGVFCHKCAGRVALIASLKSWLLGWWGFPWGPPYTLDALLRNLKGGDMPADANAHLLRHQALAFFLEGKFALSRALCEQALSFARGDAALREKLLEIINAMPGEAGTLHRLRNRWNPFTLVTLAQFVPLAALVILAFIIILR